MVVVCIIQRCIGEKLLPLYSSQHIYFATLSVFYFLQTQFKSRSQKERTWFESQRGTFKKYEWMAGWCMKVPNYFLRHYFFLLQIAHFSQRNRYLKGWFLKHFFKDSFRETPSTFLFIELCLICFFEHYVWEALH